MSKFEELCKIHAAEVERRYKNGWSCYRFADLLLKTMNEDFQCPEGQARFMPLKGEFDPLAQYTAGGVMHLEEDTFWHLGVCLTLTERLSVFPQPMISLRFLIKKVDAYFIVKFGPQGIEFKIDKDKPDEFNSLFEIVFKQIKERLEKGPHQELKEDGTVIVKGFTQREKV